MSKTLVIGAAFVDVLMDVPKLPTTGEDISGHLRANIVGGSAFNVYGAIKYTGQDADLFVPVGEGQYADLVSENMAKMGIRPLLKVNGADNGWDISFVEPDGERSFLTVNGIEQLWKPDWFENIDISNYDFFILVVMKWKMIRLRESSWMRWINEILILRCYLMLHQELSIFLKRPFRDCMTITL